MVKGPETDMSRPGIEPGPPAWEASTLDKSHLDSLFGIRNCYLSWGGAVRVASTVQKFL